MGSGSWSHKAWDTYATTSGMSSKSTEEIYATSMHKDLDPKEIKFRESRDSDGAESNAIIVAQDVTGSMGMVLDVMARKGLPALMKEIYDRKPVVGPQVCCMGIGDVEARDRAPLQVTQFESDIRIATDMEKIYLEQGGGGNNYESYALAWYFAAHKTKIDCFEKRGKKGYLFTIGDEQPTPYLLKDNLNTVFGPGEAQGDIKMEDLLTMASRQWEIFHLIVEEGSHGRDRETHDKWTKILGQRALHLADHTKLAEVIVSAIQVAEGVDHKTVADSWDGTTSLVVAKAIKGVAVGTNAAAGVVTL